MAICSSTCASSARPTVYLIEDSDVLRSSLSDALGERGYEVQAFDSAEGFLAAESPDSPHLIVTDKNLEGISGIELISRHRRQHHAFEAILITADADMESALEALRLGLYGYLRKPFNTKDLLAEVGGAATRLHRVTAERNALRWRDQERGLLETIDAPLQRVTRNLAGVHPDLASECDPATARRIGQCRTALRGLKHYVEEQSILAELRSGRQHLEPARVALKTVLKSLIKQLAPNDDEVILRIDQDITATADRNLVRRAIRAMLDCAWCQHAGNSRLVISTLLHQRWAVVDAVFLRSECADDDAALIKSRIDFARHAAQVLGGDFVVEPLGANRCAYRLILPAAAQLARLRTQPRKAMAFQIAERRASESSPG